MKLFKHPTLLYYLLIELVMIVVINIMKLAMKIMILEKY